MKRLTARCSILLSGLLLSLGTMSAGCDQSDEQAAATAASPGAQVELNAKTYQLGGWYWWPPPRR